MNPNDGNGSGRLGGFEAPRRNNYYYGKLLDVLHFQMEQSYGNDKRWLMNRLSLGTGVLCGLGVEARQDGMVCVTPGVAIDGWGREIIVPIRMCMDPWEQMAECEAGQGPLSRDNEHRLSLILCYAECATDYAPVLVSDCNTREASAPGTTVETFRLLLRPEKRLPDTPPEPEPGFDPALCRALLGTPPPDAQDGPRGSRDALCKALAGPCAALPQDACVCLATVQLLPGGRIGRIDTCNCRPLVYSNAVLFEMILCLAARIEECCDKTNNSSIRVARVLLLQGDNGLVELDPQEPVAQLSNVTITAIAVAFDKPVKHDSVIAGKSFLLRRNGTSIQGTVQPDGPNAVRFEIPTPGTTLGAGNFRLTLKGNGSTAIQDVSGSRLDGEPLKLPSGDGTPGGDFEVGFRIVKDES